MLYVYRFTFRFNRAIIHRESQDDTGEFRGHEKEPTAFVHVVAARNEALAKAQFLETYRHQRDHPEYKFEHTNTTSEQLHAIITEVWQ